MAQVLVLMSSPRKHGNTDRLADAFIKESKKMGILQKRSTLTIKILNLV